MSKWKLGTILRRNDHAFLVMVISRNESNNAVPVDETGVSYVSPGEYVGMTLIDPNSETTSGFYPVGGTCWIDEHEGGGWQVIAP